MTGLPSYKCVIKIVKKGWTITSLELKEVEVSGGSSKTFRGPLYTVPEYPDRRVEGPCTVQKGDVGT